MQDLQVIHLFPYLLPEKESKHQLKLRSTNLNSFDNFFKLPIKMPNLKVVLGKKKYLKSSPIIKSQPDLEFYFFLYLIFISKLQYWLVLAWLAQPLLILDIPTQFLAGALWGMAIKKSNQNYSNVLKTELVQISGREIETFSKTKEHANCLHPHCVNNVQCVSKKSEQIPGS